MALLILPSIIVNTIYVLQIRHYFVPPNSSPFFELLYSFLNNWSLFCCWLSCFFLKLSPHWKTVTHRRPSNLPKDKFICKCFCWTQLKRNCRCDQYVIVTSISTWPFLEFAVSSASIATPFWNENEFFWNIIQNKIYDIFLSLDNSWSSFIHEILQILSY